MKKAIAYIVTLLLLPISSLLADLQEDFQKQLEGIADGFVGCVKYSQRNACNSFDRCQYWQGQLKNLQQAPPAGSKSALVKMWNSSWECQCVRVLVEDGGQSWPAYLSNWISYVGLKYPDEVGRDGGKRFDPDSGVLQWLYSCQG